MIDLHGHYLPGIDDGATDLAQSLEMARLALADGIRIAACTPHIFPGVWSNNGHGILEAVEQFRLALEEAKLPLKLISGADVQMSPTLIQGLRSGEIPTLNNSRYFLFEPPHHVKPPRLEEFVFEVLAAGYQPLITHPERLRWVESNYDVMGRLVKGGAWMQITAGSLTGRFGSRAQLIAERMLNEGLVHVLATDAHNVGSRAPILSVARDIVAGRLGGTAAHDMVVTRPQAVLDDLDPAELPAPVGRSTHRPPSFLKRLFRAA